MRPVEVNLRRLLMTVGEMHFLKIACGNVKRDNNDRDNPMRKKHIDSMPFDELWRLHEEITKVLAERIIAEKRELEKRLAQLNRSEIASEIGASQLATALVARSTPRRKYPRVLPKYRNPLSPSETWSGRGKTPHWLANALKKGRKIDDFRIVHADKSSE